MPIGSQTYPHRQMIVDGKFPELLKMLKGIGVGSIELCSALGYKEFASLSDAKQVKRIIADAGLTCESAHFSMNELRTTHEQAVAWAKEIGITQMVTATLGMPPKGAPVDMDYVKKAADEYNQIAAVSAKAGLQQGLHNETFEVAMVDGQRVYDLLFGLLDPALVKFQFQMSTINAGLVGADYFTKYAGRFNSMHVQDIDMNAPLPPPPPDADVEDAATARRPSVGKGTIDWVEDVHRGEEGRREELLRRADLGADRAERRVSQDAQRAVASCRPRAPPRRPAQARGHPPRDPAIPAGYCGVFIASCSAIDRLQTRDRIVPLCAHTHADRRPVCEAGAELELSCRQPFPEWRLHVQSFANRGCHQPFANGKEHLPVARLLREPRRRHRSLAGPLGDVVLGQDAPSTESQPGVDAGHPTLAVGCRPTRERQSNDGPAGPEDVEFGQRATARLPVAGWLGARRGVHERHELIPLSADGHLQLGRRIVVPEPVARPDEQASSGTLTPIGNWSTPAAKSRPFAG